MRLQLYIIEHNFYLINDLPTLMLAKILLDGWYASYFDTLDARKSYRNIKLVNKLKKLKMVE